LRKRPAATSVRSIRLVVAMTRTSSGISLPPAFHSRLQHAQ
jgi:hypothetical protein